MNEDREKFSAWLDDAWVADDFDRALPGNDTCPMEPAARYHLIGDALRGEIEDNSLSDISASVREAIEAEPAHHVSVIPLQSRSQRDRKPLFDLSRWLMPAGGFALAASVAMIMVVTVTRQETPPGADAVVAASAPQPAGVVPVSHQPGPAAPARSYAANEPPAMPAVNLNYYMEEHSEYAAQDTMQGLMPYARAVSYQSR